MERAVLVLLNYSLSVGILAMRVGSPIQKIVHTYQ